MTSAQDVDAYKQSVRTMWSAGDYQKLAERVAPIADHLCRATAVASGQAVLDVATGSGNVALAAAARGAVVTAVDLTPAMLDLSRRRAEEEGLAVTAVLGDAEDLPLEDRSFDVVLSACGLWWAPRPDVAVAEVRRVLRRPGVVGLAGFTPDSYFGQVEELIKAQLPLPDGVPERNDWARDDSAVARLEGLFTDIEVGHGSIDWTFGSAPEATAFLFDNSASHIAAHRQLDPGQGAALVADVRRLTERMSRTTDHVSIDLEYAVVVGHLPA